MGNLCYRIVTAVLHACDFIHSVTYLPDFRNIHYEIGDIETLVTPDRDLHTRDRHGLVIVFRDHERDTTSRNIPQIVTSAQIGRSRITGLHYCCLLYTSDAADE